MDCEIDDDYMNKTFGTYAKNPSDFRFKRGDLKLINELVPYVKNIVDEKGPNTGLSRFKFVEKKARKPRRIRPKQCDAKIPIKKNEHKMPQLNLNEEKTSEEGMDRNNAQVSTKREPNDIHLIKSSLFERIKICLQRFCPDVDVDNLDETIIKVQFDENNEIFGSVARPKSTKYT